MIRLLCLPNQTPPITDKTPQMDHPTITHNCVVSRPDNLLRAIYLDFYNLLQKGFRKRLLQEDQAEERVRTYQIVSISSFTQG